jgi:hypothetical protein
MAVWSGEILPLGGAPVRGGGFRPVDQPRWPNAGGRQAFAFLVLDAVRYGLGDRPHDEGSNAQSGKYYRPTWTPEGDVDAVVSGMRAAAWKFTRREVSVAARLRAFDRVGVEKIDHAGWIGNKSRSRTASQDSGIHLFNIRGTGVRQNPS